MMGSRAGARLNEWRIRARAHAAVLADAYAAVASRVMDNALHARHGTTVMVGLESDVCVTTARKTMRGRVVLVPPHVEHAASCAGPSISVMYDPQIAGWRSGVLEGKLADRLRDAVVGQRASLNRADVLDGLAREMAPWMALERRPGDARVAQVLEALRDPEAPLAVGLSRKHLGELFAREVGMTVAAYRLWSRLQLALAAFSREDATTSAHLAGFADLAHFSRTCRRMLGASPTAIRSRLLGI